MDSIFRDNFRREIKRLARPFFNEQGFKGNGLRVTQTIEEEIVNTIYIQSDRNGEKCCVNVSTRFLFVEEPFLDHARIRLKPNGIDDGGYWWSFDNPEGPYEIVQLLKTEGVSFFNRYLPFPGELDQLNEKLIMEGRSQGILPSLLKGRALLVLAKYCEYVERIPMCVSVAKTGSGHD